MWKASFIGEASFEFSDILASAFTVLTPNSEMASYQLTIWNYKTPMPNLMMGTCEL